MVDEVNISSLGSPEEERRLAVLARYHILDTPHELSFDRIAEVAARLFNVPYACVTLVDRDRVWFKASCGLELTEIEREDGLCATSFAADDVVAIPDTRENPVSANNSLVTGDFNLRFYCGAPLRSMCGLPLGTLCLFGHEVRPITDAEIDTLRDLAALVMDQLELRRSSIELQHTEAALRESERSYQALTRVAPAGIARSNRAGECVFMNEMGCTLVGLTSEQLLGMGWTKAIHPEDRERVLKERSESYAKGVEFHAEYRFLHRDGRIVWVLASSHPERAEDGNIISYVGTIVDITDRKRVEREQQDLERQVQHTQKLESLGVLAGGIAHDFNNILQGILGNADLALETLQEEDSAHEDVIAIQSAAGRAASLCDQMLAYAGKGRFVIETLDVNEVLEEMTDLLRVTVSKKVEFQLQLGGGPLLIEADVTQVRQVMMNLITNASEAIGEQRGEVKIRTGLQQCSQEFLNKTFLNEDMAEGEYVFFEVCDTGCGMTPETLARIFDPFFTTKFTGRGLGMAAVLGIVRGHGGAIDIRTEDGRGATFWVALPSAISGRKAIGEKYEVNVGRRSILVVDDEDLVRNVARKALENHGFNVLLAEDGLQALEIMTHDPRGIDAVLLDMTMPNLSGEETFRQIRKIRPNVSVLFSSGFNEKDALGSLTTGDRAASFIKKPYRPRDLVAKLRQLVAPLGT